MHNREGARFCKQCRNPLAVVARCTQCGVTLRTGARFCSRCGTPVIGQATALRQIRCPSCGTANRASARFCRICSHPLREQDEVPPPLFSSLKGRAVPAVLLSDTGNLLPSSMLSERYFILDKIAQGGMSAVYKAEDHRLQDRVVAIKEMTVSMLSEEDRQPALESFQREAKLLAQLAHPNMVRVSDYFYENDRYYMVMEYIEGESLHSLLESQTQPFAEAQVLVWAVQLCDVLGYLHAQKPKIIYRDIKPSNVMITSDAGDVKLIDFGIARFYKPGQKKDTVEFGTSGYAPPEQYGKAQTDERSDIYALGVMMHQLLTLHDPGTTLFKLPPVRQLRSEISSSVANAIAKAAAPNPEDRYASAIEFRLALLDAGIPSTGEASRDQITLQAEFPSPCAFSIGLTSPSPTAELNLGTLEVGIGRLPFVLTFALPADERACLRPDVDWLCLERDWIDEEHNQVTLVVDTSQLHTGRLQLQGGVLKRWVGWHARLMIPISRSVQAVLDITLDKSGQEIQIPVLLTISPTYRRVQLGWGMMIAALLLEIAAVLGVVVVLMV